MHIANYYYYYYDDDIIVCCCLVYDHEGYQGTMAITINIYIQSWLSWKKMFENNNEQEEEVFKKTTPIIAVIQWLGNVQLGLSHHKPQQNFII